MNAIPAVLPFPSSAQRENKPRERPKRPISYVEFAVASNFSCLRGASHPEELMGQAEYLGLAGLGLCDRNSVAGVVRAHLAKRENDLKLRYHPGARLVFSDGTPDILAYPRDRAGWGKLCRLLTRGNLRAEKGECILHLDDLLEHAEGLELVVMPTSTRESAPRRLSESRAAALAFPPPEGSCVLPLKSGASSVPSPLAGQGGGYTTSSEPVTPLPTPPPRASRMFPTC